MSSKSVIAASIIVSIFSTEVLAQLVIYPAKGQSAAQQQKDEGECYSWAKGQTGYDPAQASQVSSSPEQAVGGERVRGATRGALGGAVIGEIADDDAGKGAAIGAVVGTMRGGVRQRQKQVDNQQASAKQKQSSAAQQEGFQKAYAACFEGKGYTVK